MQSEPTLLRKWFAGAVVIWSVFLAGCDDPAVIEAQQREIKEMTPSDYMSLSPRHQKKVKTTRIYIPDPYRNGELPPQAKPWSSRLELAVREGNNEFFAWQHGRTLFELSMPHVEVEFLYFDMWAAEFQALLSTSLHSERSPAYYIARNLPDSIEDGWFADITGYLEDWPAARNHRHTRFGGMFAGKIYCIPGPEDQWPVVQYRKDWFAEVGIFNEFGEPGPRSDWTWAEFREYARRLTRDNDGDGKIDQWGIVTHRSGFDLLYMGAEAIGRRLFIPDKSGEFTWRFNYDDPQLVEAIRQIRAMFHEDKSVRTGVDFDWQAMKYDFFASKAAMAPVTTCHPPADYTENPYVFGKDIETKYVLGMVPTPADRYRTRYPLARSNMYGFNPTYSPAQLEAAVAYFRSWVCGYINRLNLDGLQEKNRLMERPDPYPRYYLISPYKSEVPLATPEPQDYYPKDYTNTYRIYRTADVFPRPRDVGLTEPKRFDSALDSLFSELLFADEDVDIEEVLVEHAKKIHARCMKFKVADDREKLKAYYEAVTAFVQKNLPPEGIAEWTTFIEKKCRCW
jgi:hypothetical protein